MITTSIISLLVAGLGLTILIKNPRQKETIFFFLFCLFISCWTVALYLSNTSQVDLLVIWWTKATWIIGPPLIIAFCFFLHSFVLKSRISKKLYILAILSIALDTYTFTIGSGLSNHVSFLQNVAHVDLGPSFWVFYLTFFPWFIFCIYLIFRGAIKTTGLDQIRGKLILFTFLPGILFMVVLNVVLVSSGIPQYSYLGPLGMVPVCIGTAYMIIKYRLFNIQIQLQKTVNFFIPILLSTLLTVLLAYGLYQYVYWGGEINGIILLIFYTLSYRFFNYLFTKTKLSYLLFQKTYHFHQSLVEFSNRASDIPHFDTLIKELQQTFLQGGLVNAFAFFVITNQEKKSCHVYETHNINPAELAICAESVLHPFLHHELTMTREPLVIDELVYSNKPELKELKKAFHPLEGGVCIPLFVSNDLAGLILLGPKEHNGAYTIEDIKVFQQISTSLAVAVTKALLFTHYREQVIELSRDKRNLEESVVELKRMKNEFLTIVDHQFNTPLSIIESAFSMIQDGDVPLGEIKEYVTSMAPRIQEFRQIVEDMLRAAHFEGTGTDLKFSLVNVTDLLTSLVEKNQTLATEHGTQFNVKLPSSLPRVTSDPEQLQAALDHIFRNAIIYGGQKPVTIAAELTKKEHVLITISDQGRGFTTDEGAHFGEKFFRGKGTVDYLANGSGLGLFIAKKIIEASGGTLSWQSEGPEQGSTFEIELPKGSEFVKTRPVIPQ
jgi:signal transduction histidine kinase